jgi:hypothetical protein
LILHSYCIEEAIKEHFTEYDFLRMGGKGGGYKNDWGNYNRPLFDLRISRRTLKEGVYQMARKSASYLRGGYRDNGNKRDRANSNPATAVEVKSVLNEAH